MSDDVPSRRQFIGGGLAAAATATAGCLGILGGDEAADNERELTLDMHRVGERLRDEFLTDLSETPMEYDEQAFEATLDGESYTTQYHPPFHSTPEDPVYAEHEGTYYRLGSVVVGEEPETNPVLRISEVESGDPSNAVAHSALPDHDQRAVRVAWFAARARGNVGGVPIGLVQRGGYVYRNETAIERSELLAEDGPDRVAYRDSVWAVEIARERFYEPVHRATVEPVAESPAELEAVLRAKFVDARFSRADLSEEALDVVESAGMDSYSETHPFSAAYEEVLRELHARAYIDGNVEKDSGVDSGGQRYVRFEDSYYDYALGFL